MAMDFNGRPDNSFGDFVNFHFLIFFYLSFSVFLCVSVVIF